MLAKEQYIGAIVLLGIAIAIWVFIAVYSASHPASIPEDEWSWAQVDSLRRDSIAQARVRRDSLREARWERYKDSCRRADDARFAAWTAERQLRYDSFRLADSLWRDSVGWRYVKMEKKDTILDLNTADTTELMYIRGIGRYTARRIIAYREQLGGFYSPEQLRDEELKKLGTDTLINHFIASPEHTRKIDVNRCSAATLSRHPYLRYEQAKAIYHYRRLHARIKQIEELYAIDGLDSLTIERMQYYLRFE